MSELCSTWITSQRSYLKTSGWALSPCAWPQILFLQLQVGICSWSGHRKPCLLLRFRGGSPRMQAPHCQDSWTSKIKIWGNCFPFYKIYICGGGGWARGEWSTSYAIWFQWLWTVFKLPLKCSDLERVIHFIFVLAYVCHFLILDAKRQSLLGGHSPTEQRSPTSSASGGGFVEGTFSTDQGAGMGWGRGFRVVSLPLLCTLFLLSLHCDNEIIIQLTIMQHHWEPWACFPAT